MDATTIRIILIIVGAFLLLALYLWERRQESLEDEDSEDEATGAGALGWASHAREAGLGAIARTAGRWVERRPQPRTADPARSPDEPTDPTERTSRAARGEPTERAERAVASSQRAEIEPLLIQLSISARGEQFSGEKLLDAAESCGLRPGRMDIFHCLDEFADDTRIYFSMANMVKPGTFPFGAMDAFATPGLMLFAQLDGRPEDVTILEEMIATARKLAEELDGEVLDDTRRPLTVRKEEVLREAVLENERRWIKAARH
ncbi:MAG: cell division protein ZipA [Sphingobacteriia bacterium]|nr:cell division protein ZipA [Sphingobacteriia bacterium]NCC38137.1 cell division protein ZipA [Gammaproteobacteria bacterium]